MGVIFLLSLRLERESEESTSCCEAESQQGALPKETGRNWGIVTSFFSLYDLHGNPVITPFLASLEVRGEKNKMSEPWKVASKSYSSM